MPTIIIQDATEEPFTLAESKLWCRVDADYTAEDGTMSMLVSAVRKACEKECGCSVMPRTLELVADEFSPSMALSRPPVIAVQSVKYLDENGVEQTLDPADYIVDKDSRPGWLVPAVDKDWPTTQTRVNAVRVRYTAGYADASAVPQDMQLWMRLHLAHYWRNREASVTGTIITPLPFAAGLLDPYRLWDC